MDRPGFEAMLDRVRSGRTGGVVVAHLDRFSRASVRDALSVVEEIRSHDARVVALDVAGLDPDDPFGEYALTMMLAVGRMQLRRIAENWANARRNAIARGVHTGPIPYGYRAGPGRHLEVDPGEADVVRRIFEQRSRGRTPLEIARWLDEVAPREGGTLWARSSVRMMPPTRPTSARCATVPSATSGAHEPIVDRALWRRAQREPGVHPGRNPRMVLARILRCASCGHLMRGSVQTGSGRLRLPLRRPLLERNVPAARVGFPGAPRGRGARAAARSPGGSRAADASGARGSEAARRGGGGNQRARALPAAHTDQRGRSGGASGRSGRARGAALARGGAPAATAPMRPSVLARPEPRCGLAGRRWPPRRSGSVLRENLDAVVVRHARSRSRHNPMAERLLVLFRRRGTRGASWRQPGHEELDLG